MYKCVYDIHFKVNTLLFIDLLLLKINWFVCLLLKKTLISFYSILVVTDLGLVTLEFDKFLTK